MLASLIDTKVAIAHGKAMVIDCTTSHHRRLHLHGHVDSSSVGCLQGRQDRP